MKTVKAYVKRMLLSVAYVAAFAVSFYVSVLFFLYLMLKEAFTGTGNPDFARNAGLLIKDIYDYPDKLRALLHPEHNGQNAIS